ncbi:MAG: diguanylate cyclase, partial [Candidatus Aureabacteria bacterium]|nr:diguanylate cyclase [Candidatus Auribacterota bacterium]
FRVIFLVTAFIVLVLIRQFAHAFAFSLGYLYLTLICLSGFWFGFAGVLVTATLSSLIFVGEVSLFPHWPHRDIVLKSMALRIFFFYCGGFAIAYLSQMERALQNRLKQLAHCDELTGCVNFRWIIEILNNEIARCKRYHKEVSVIMIDIDHFKKINDQYGHLIGNKVLKIFAEIVKNSVRKIDIVGRYGGEEFLIVLPQSTHEKAVEILDRIKGKLAQADLPAEVTDMSLKFSAGIASYPLNGKGLEEIVNVADHALYQAKREGRDRIVYERRNWIRIKPLSTLKIELLNISETESMNVLDIINISKGGMLLMTSRNVEGDDLHCRLHVPDDKPPIDLQCKVVYKEEGEENLYLVGVSFDDISKYIESRLSCFIRYVTDVI